MPKVPPSARMDDETFRKHLELRHLPEGDWAGLRTLRGGIHFSKDRKVYEMWHGHCHANWGYNHDHV